MEFYDEEQHMTDVAKSCRHFSYRGKGRFNTGADDMSCSHCSKWTGTGCTAGSYDRIVSMLDL